MTETRYLVVAAAVEGRHSEAVVFGTVALVVAEELRAELRDGRLPVRGYGDTVLADHDASFSLETARRATGVVCGGRPRGPRFRLPAQRVKSPECMRKPATVVPWGYFVAGLGTLKASSSFWGLTGVLVKCYALSARWGGHSKG
jgi:hypothetical protein